MVSTTVSTRVVPQLALGEVRTSEWILVGFRFSTPLECSNRSGSARNGFYAKFQPQKHEQRVGAPLGTEIQWDLVKIQSQTPWIPYSKTNGDFTMIRYAILRRDISAQKQNLKNRCYNFFQIVLKYTHLNFQPATIILKGSIIVCRFDSSILHSDPSFIKESLCK